MSEEIDWEAPFKPEDFQILTPGEEFRIRDSGIAADFANQRFRQLLEQAPTVYKGSIDHYTFETPAWFYNKGSTAKLTAKLIKIEELK